MTIEFRSRIPSSINYRDILNYGICCQKTSELTEITDYLSCYATGGYFIPGDKTGTALNCPEDHE